MALEQEQLDPYFLAKIFTQPIIPGKNTPVAPVEKPAVKLKFLGENQKNIGLFIQNENEAYLNDDLFNLLTNILNACKLGMQDVALLNVASAPGTPFPVYQEQLGLRQCVFFGVAPEQAGLADIPPYQLVSVSGSMLFFSDTLAVIGQDKVLKAKLWAGLKQLLGI